MKHKEVTLYIIQNIFNIFEYNEKAINTIKENEDILRDAYPLNLPAGINLYDLAKVNTSTNKFINIILLSLVTLFNHFHIYLLICF